MSKQSTVESASETRPNDDEDVKVTLEEFLEKEPQTDEQKNFNELSMEVKLARLNQLVQQSQVYSQIILDNMLEKSMQKKRLQERIDRGEVIPEVPTPKLEFDSGSSDSDSDSGSDSDSDSDSESDSDDSDSESPVLESESNDDVEEVEDDRDSKKVERSKRRVVESSEEESSSSEEQDNSSENEQRKPEEGSEAQGNSSEEQNNSSEEEQDNSRHSPIPKDVDVEVIDSESEEDYPPKLRMTRRQESLKRNRPVKSERETMSKAELSSSRLERMRRLNLLRSKKAKEAAQLFEIDLDSSEDIDLPSTRTRSGQAKRGRPRKVGAAKRAKTLPKKEVAQSKSKNTKKEKPKKKKIKKPKSTMSKETASTKRAIEAAQTGHKQNQPVLITGGTMKDYQLDGLEWLVTLYENGLNGILADEMGLGKTLECIALMAYLLEHRVKGPFLVVAPLSTVGNWCREFKTFAPRIKVLNYTGVKDLRTRYSFGKKLKAQVVVTSYDLILRDYRKFLRGDWTYLTVDEGHRLKNFDCLLIKFLKKLNVGNRLLLTGTPLQNNLKELWSLLNFILPDIFHDLELFQLWFDFDNLGESVEVEGASHEERRLFREKLQELFIKNLHSVLKPFLLRRVKKDVVRDLPPKKEYILYSDLTPMQSIFYRATIDRELPEMVLDSYIKEYLLLNRPNLFSTKEDLEKIDAILFADENASSGMTRSRQDRFDKEDIHRMLTGDMSEFIDDLEVVGSHKKSSQWDPNAEDSDYAVGSDENDSDGSNDDAESITLDPSEKERGEREVTHADRTEEDLAAEAGLDELLAQYEEEAETATPESLKEENAPINGSNKGISDAMKAHTDLGGSMMGVMTPESEDGKKEHRSNNDGKTKADLEGKSRAEGKGDGNTKPSDSFSENETFYSVEDHPDDEVIEISSGDEDEQDLDQFVQLVRDTSARFTRYVNSMPLKNMVMQMRKVCCSHFCFYNPFNQHTDYDAKLAQRLLENSGKMQMLRQLLRRLIPDGHKVLIFSQFTTALDFIRLMLEEEGIQCSQLDGRTKLEDREDEMQEFSRKEEDSTPVFLLSTRAGGLGLNLVSADTVILFDNDWNPQMDLQAIDRAHRIGQTRPVKVFRFVVRDTVEELLILRSFSKRLLEKMVIQEGDFRLGGLARKLAQVNIDISEKTTMSSIIDLGERLNLLGASKDRESTDNFNDILLQPHTVQEPLTSEEMEELMDRSDACYARGPLTLQNVTSFEATNTKAD